MDNQHCSAGDGSCKKGGIKCIIPVLAVFATIFGFEWIFHGVYMMPQYEATSGMWRTQEEMQALWPLCIVTKLVMAGIITCLFCCVAKGCADQGKCPKTAVKFGLKIGVLLGAFQAASYGWLPIPVEMAVSWFVGYVIMGALIGLVLMQCARMCKKG